MIVNSAFVYYIKVDLAHYYYYYYYYYYYSKKLWNSPINEPDVNSLFLKYDNNEALSCLLAKADYGWKEERQILNVCVKILYSDRGLKDVNKL